VIISYQHDPHDPDGLGCLFREVPDGAAFTWYENVQDPARRRVVTCIATNFMDAHPGSSQPYDRRLAIELTTGHYYWLSPEAPVVLSPLQVVPR
jgi:hypothetical protein